jgi:hypothetical protein
MTGMNSIELIGRMVAANAYLHGVPADHDDEDEEDEEDNPREDEDDEEGEEDEGYSE